MSEASTRRVMETTWNWRSGLGGGPVPLPGNLRRSAVTQAAVMALVAAFLFYGLHHELLARVVLGLAGLVLVLGLAFPPAYRPVHAFGRWLGRVVGKALTYVLLVPFFYLFFTPVAMALRAQGRDPLHRRFRDPQWTYWIRRSPKARDENIDKQFLREEKECRSEFRNVGPEARPDSLSEGSDRS